MLVRLIIILLILVIIAGAIYLVLPVQTCYLRKELIPGEPEECYCLGIKKIEYTNLGQIIRCKGILKIKCYQTTPLYTY